MSIIHSLYLPHTTICRPLVRCIKLYAYRYMCMSNQRHTLYLKHISPEDPINILRGMVGLDVYLVEVVWGVT